MYWTTQHNLLSLTEWFDWLVLLLGIWDAFLFIDGSLTISVAERDSLDADEGALWRDLMEPDDAREVLDLNYTPVNVNNTKSLIFTQCLQISDWQMTAAILL